MNYITPSILDNKELIAACRKNSRKAQMELYNKYSKGMYYVAYRFFKDSFLAEEAMQESFIKAFAKLDQFTGDVTFGAWLKRIVINKSIDMLKARKLDTIALNEQIMTTAEEYDNWEIENTASTTAIEIKQAIDNLPEKYKFPVHLFLLEGYDHNEIAEVLNITAVSSRTLVHRGKKRLQEQLKHLKKDGTGY